MLRRRRFGLKALFVAVLSLSVPCAWFAYEAARLRRQRAAVQEIESMPGGVFYDNFYDGDRFRFQTKPEPRLSQYFFGENAFSDVTYVYVGSSFHSAPGQMSFTRLHQNISDKDVPRLKRALADLPEVQHLDLQATRISTVGVRQLESAFPGIEIEYDTANDKGYRPIILMKRLPEWHEDDATSATRRIKSADLRDASFGNADLAMLYENELFSAIQSLDLRGTVISDEGLVHLERLKSLEVLRLEDTSVTQQGVEGLRRALPNCEIRY